MSIFKIRNVQLFIAFRVLFNARFYYPIFTILFLDFGLSLEQFAILNTVWAAAIVLFDVPAGALADVLGRKKLLIAAGIFMIAEMAILCFVPKGNIELLFWAFALNRVLSGAAESCASGADEALAYESLQKQVGAEKINSEWAKVLERLSKLQSIGFVVAMTVGAAVYDSKLNTRYPLYLNLLTAFGVLWIALQMREENAAATAKNVFWKTVKETNHMILNAGKWIVSTPFALALVCTGFIFDSVIRMFMTLGGQYYRQIGFPESSFGIIGSCFAALGFVTPIVARFMVGKFSALTNLLILSVTVFIGLLGLSQVFPTFGGLVFAVVLYSSMSFVGFFLSHYLNQIARPQMRATLLSFKSLLFNLFYGLIGIAYSVLVAGLRQSSVDKSDASVFKSALAYFPWYFFVMISIFFMIYAFWPRKTRNESAI